MDSNAAVHQAVVEGHVIAAARAVEDHLDDQLHRLDTLGDEELEALRERRLRQLRQLAARRGEWLAKGHGTYQEIASEKEFFAEVKGSEHVVCHFFRDNWPCKVVDKHLGELAARHLEAKFVRINAEKSPFLTERLRIFMLPTIALVNKGKVEDYVVGFDELGGTDDFDTEVLERRLARSGVISGEEEGGGLLAPRRAAARGAPPRSVRQEGAADGSDED